MERYILSNGMQVPMIGFGCYTPEPDGYSEVIRNAIEVGFTYFNGASVYGTERQIAKGIKESGVSRKELQLVSKAWTDEMGYRNVREACCRSLDRLETDYLDIYMIHWPKARADKKSGKRMIWKHGAVWKKRLCLRSAFVPWCRKVSCRLPKQEILLI